MHLRNSCYIAIEVHFLSEIRYAHGFNSITPHCTPSTFEIVFCLRTSELYTHPYHFSIILQTGSALVLKAMLSLWHIKFERNQAVTFLASKLMITWCLQDWAPVLSFVRGILAEQWGPTPQEKLLSGGENKHHDSPLLRESHSRTIFSQQ